MAPERLELHTKIVKAVWWNNGQDGCKVGMAGVKAIEIVEIPGEMAYLPWAKVLAAREEVVLVNLQRVETIEYVEKAEGGGG